jgi:nitrite reductase (NO-forming)
MKSTLAFLAIFAILLSGSVFLPGINMKAYSLSSGQDSKLTSVGLVMDGSFKQVSAQEVNKSVSHVKHFTFVAKEENLTLPDGQKVHALTFNGTIPAPTIRVTQGDTVNITIINPSTNKLIHSLDNHFATVSAVPAYGPIKPGETKSYVSIATVPGFFKFHCEGNGVLTMDQHVFSGMVGGVIVDPVGGYTGYKIMNAVNGSQISVSPKAKEAQLEFSEYYLTNDGNYNQKAMFDHNATSAWINGIPFGYDPVVTKTKNATPLFFNTGDHVRLFILNHGDWPVNFHIVGEMLDRVNEGNVVSANGAQTYTVGGSNGVIVDVVFDKPGVYAFVNHDYSQLFKGQVGIFVIDGPDHAISKKLGLKDDSNPSNAIPPLGIDSITVKTKPYFFGSPLNNTTPLGKLVHIP